MRVIVDPPSDGAWNMAVDEALLTAVAGGEPLTLRLYQWAPPTLSLGYFQEHRGRDTHAASRTCPLVRRATGGGAILHDHELTYSLAVPADHPCARQRERLYEVVHESLRTVLSRRGVAAYACAHAHPQPAIGPQFLCFQRLGAGDLLLDRSERGTATQTPCKVAGSAQRRQQGAILQHGSLLLAASTHAPELPGIQELSAIAILPEELADDWPQTLSQSLGCRVEPGSLSDALSAQARQLADAKYGCAAWRNRR